MLGQSQEQIGSHDPNAPRLHIDALFDPYVIDMASDWLNQADYVKHNPICLIWANIASLDHKKAKNWN